MLTIRTARPDELAELSNLCLRSKAVWGYDTSFMDASKAELTLTESDLDVYHVAVAETDRKIIGVAQLHLEGLDAELLKLFVEPSRLRSGTGQLLFDWACETAKDLGATTLYIEADPDAAPFYRHMGARDVGLAPSGSIPGRMLPMLARDL